MTSPEMTNPGGYDNRTQEPPAVSLEQIAEARKHLHAAAELYRDSAKEPWNGLACVMASICRRALKALETE